MNKSVKTEKIISFGLFFIFLAVVFLMIPVTYAINDDVAMRDIASGAMSGSPDYHLVFVKAALGALLSAVYRYFPGIDWYGLVWMGLVILSAALILWKILSICEKRGRNLLAASVLFLSVFALTGLGHLVSFQFTVVAGIVAGTAVFLYCLDDSSGKKEYRMAALVILLIWISFCVRENVLLMAVPFGGLIILYKKEPVKKKALMASIACAGLAGIMVLEVFSYSSAEWKSYKDYNTARSVIYDYYGVPPYEENREFYDSIGLQEYDVVNLERYQLVFVDDLENGKMQQIADYAEQRYREQNSLTAQVIAGARIAVQGELGKETLVLNLLAKALVLLNIITGIRYRKKRLWLVNAGFLICEGALAFYLGYEGRLPARVMAALLIIEFLSALAVFLLEQRNAAPETAKKIPGWTAGLLIVLLAAAVWQFAVIRERQLQSTAANQEYELLQSYYREHPEQVYFIPATWTAGYTENFHIRKEARLDNGFSLGGWTTFLPVHEQGLKKFGIEDENTALIENDNVYLIFNTPSSRITAYYEQKYEDVQWTETDTAPVYGMEVPVFKISGGERR